MSAPPLCPTCGTAQRWYGCPACNGHGAIEQRDGALQTCLTCLGAGGAWLCPFESVHAPDVAALLDAYRRESPEGRRVMEHLLDDVLREQGNRE